MNVGRASESGTQFVTPEVVFAGGGEMGAMMRSFDWAETSLRRVELWPQSLRTAVSVMLESAFAMVVAWGPDFILLYNDRFRGMLGPSKHPAGLGRPASEILAETWDSIGPHFRRAIGGTGVAVDGVLMSIERDGHLENGHFTLSYSPIRDESGGVGGVLCVIAEMTPRIALESAGLYRVAESQVTTPVLARRALEGVLARVPVPIVLVEPETARILFSNKAADDLWGGPLPKATSVKEYEQLFRAVDASGHPLPAERHPAIRAARGEDVVAQEFDLETPRGRVMLLVDSARVPLLPDHPETIVMTYRDVTKLVLTERALREAVQVRDDFLSVASHELNTPLTPLKLHLASLLSTEWSDPVRRKLQVADRQVDRLAALVSELLEVSRITAGRLEMDPSHVDVLAVVRTVIEHVGGTNGSARISIGGASAFADVDVGRLEQVVTNLITNAIKYGEGKPIDIEVARDIAEIVVRVRDRGMGIAPEKQQRIFERFERAVSVRHFGGFGLGLWIVRQIVERWGGHVSVASQPGQGSVFSFTIPTPVGSA